MRMVFVARGVLVSALAALLAPGVGCTTNPTTGRSQLNMLSREEEIALGEEAKGPLTKEYGGAVADQELQGYVREVGMAMVPHTEADAPSLPWEFTLLDSDVINAFALPGGKVFMSRGLAEKMTNEAQLAAVLGHEIGHVTAEHVDERISASYGAQTLLAGVAVLAGASESAILSGALPRIVEIGGQGYLLKYGRDQELEADALGVRYMTKAGWDPLGALQVQQLLEAEAEGGRPPELLSTHPYPERRQERIRELLDGEYAFTQNNGAYQLHADRYRQRFLNRVAIYLPPEMEQERRAYAHAAWCSICAGP